MSEKTLLAIDQGTTSSRAVLFSAQGKILAVRQRELKLHYPHKGWVEQDANDIWNDTLWACRELLNAAAVKPACIGITNQRETTIVWDRKTGEPIYNAIVWQDRRTADVCEALKAQGHEPMIAAKTGLLLDPYFSATKLAWILNTVEGARKSAEAGDLAFGTVDSYLLWKLTGGKSHATDITNASRTMLYNIVEQKWDADLLKLFDIPANLLPEVKDNVCDFGVTDKNIIGAEISVGGMAGDQQAALIGQGCFTPGMVKSTYGTGCFALMNIGPQFKASHNRLLTTVAYRVRGEIAYAIEGSIFNAGTAIQWLRDGMGFFENAPESEALALSVPDTNEVYIVPAFTGLGAPYWQPNARGLIAGLSRESTKAHITRAALEAQAYQTLDLMAAMQDDSGYLVGIIRADGGLVANNFMCQFLSSMLQKPVEVPEISESTAWGAAALAGVQCGIFKGLEDIARSWTLSRRFDPALSLAERDKLYSGWKRAVAQTLAGCTQVSQPAPEHNNYAAVQPPSMD
jgi:glycerol kinase